jgi:hypothetical protein
MIKTYNILDSIAGSAADISLQNGILSITGAPKMPFGRITAQTVLPYITEVREVVTLTPTAANSTNFSLLIRQFNKDTGITVEEVIPYTTAASGDTATTICNGWRSVIATRPNLKLAATGSSTLVLTATSGYPLITVTVTGAGTVTQATTFVNSAGTSLAGLAAGSVTGTISSGVLTVPHTSHGLTTGMVVTVTDAALTFTDRAGVAVVGSYTGRITVVNANSFTMDDVTVSGTPTTNGAAYTAVAQPARGTKADLDSKGYTGGTSGNLYEEWKFELEDLSTVSGQSQIRQHSILVNASESDFAALRTAFNNLRGGGTAASATTANTEADAVS